MKETDFNSIKEKLKNKETVTLRDIFKVMDKEKDTFAIGAHSSFIFMGDYDSFRRDLDALEYYYKIVYEKTIDKLFNEFCLKALQKEVLNSIGRHVNSTEKDITEEYKDSQKEAFLAKLKRKNIPMEFIPYIDRPVKDFYLKILKDEPKFAIILEGVEAGRCWVQNEYGVVINEIKTFVLRYKYGY